ncbi:peptidase [Caviibacterium pharyngocola]|uniref:endopeptidase La n=1 Tax=Caviibacterium pharyngocola TaxID=28159 RepID=A0A2M8RV45_9PAST|nr:Lon protease family protein [Caviibacterium pharyngocola]PJG82757.1 peptidase [Caviibacterium pharyngocola]
MILSSLSEQALSWQDLRPNLAVDAVNDPNADFFALQPRAVCAVQQFLQNNHRTLLVLKADDQSEYAPLLADYIRSQQAQDLVLSGVRYVVEQGDSFSFPTVSVEPAQSYEDNFAATQSVATALHTDHTRLFGAVRVHPGSQDIQLHPGLVHQLNNGVLILSVETLLAQFDLWIRLKHILTTKTFDWYALHPYKALPCDIPSCPLSLKVILLGNRTELAMFEELDEGLYSLADYAEIDSYFSVESAQKQQQWANFVVGYARARQLAQPTPDGLNRLYQLLVRESEDRDLINVSPLKLKEILTDTAALTAKSELSAVDFEQYFHAKSQQQGFLREQTYADILREQVYVATEGEIVGQINGLSVIEYPGTPLSFGEPSRISCIVQFGDGEVVDVERKNELAGNIHGKGIMIAEVCLANILDFPSQLPFSASIVFEQSYSEIDGDSASLASFCVLASALSDLPLPQSVAITGAIDQFGLVHSVGGVNDKIEGFFTICERRGLSGEQGVIIPSTVVSQLSLSEAVISAVKNGQFSIWTVDDVYQACEILFKRHLTEEENVTYTEENQPLSRVISRRIELRAEQQQRIGLWDLLFRKR